MHKSRPNFVASVLLVTSALFAGSSAFGTASPAQPGASVGAPGAGPCSTPPSLWASEGDFYGTVAGYGGASMVPTCVIALPNSWLAPQLVVSIGLATDASGTLYVADNGHHRIAEFTKNGYPIASFTTDVGGTHAPQGVCVSPNNLVGVPTTHNGTNGNIEVFTQSGTLVGSATDPNLAIANYCAFDRAGDLFVNGDGNSGGAFIWYLNHNQVNTPGGSLTLSNAGNSNWLGMYSRVNSNTLSAAAAPYSGPGCSYCVSVTTWIISGSGTLTLALANTCTITGYPGWQTESVRQVAPDTSGNLYIADWLGHKLERTASCSNGGNQAASTLSPAIFPSPPGLAFGQVTVPSQLYWGVATYPTGQY